MLNLGKSIFMRLGLRDKCEGNIEWSNIEEQGDIIIKLGKEFQHSFVCLWDTLDCAEVLGTLHLFYRIVN